MNVVEKFDVGAAMVQIAGGFKIKIPCLTSEEIESHTRPRKRVAKKKYHFLSFDVSDEEEFFEMAAEKNDAWESSHRKKRRRRNASKISDISITIPYSTTTTTVDTIPKIKTEMDSMPSYCELKPRITMEAQILKPTSEVTTYTTPVITQTKTEIPTVKTEEILLPIPSPVPRPQSGNSKIGKIRVLSAAELGSTIIFLDDPPTRQTKSPISVMSVGSSSTTKNTVVPQNNANTSVNIKVAKIGDLYQKFFTPRNQFKIRGVAEILQNIAENIKNNNERLSEINGNNKMTDPQKLMLRYSSYQEFKRTKEANERKLREKFQLVMNLFNEENFETLFQLFFLGMLKILIVSVSNVYKKGTLFKKLLNLLSSSLQNSGYKNERVFEILKSKDFREKCIGLVQFIEKYSKTELFGMLFLSEDDKKLIKTKNNDKDGKSSKHDSFLLNLLKDSKSSENVSAIATQPTLNGSVSRKTYGPASKNVTNNPPAPVNVHSTPIRIQGYPNITIQVPVSHVNVTVNNVGVSSSGIIPVQNTTNQQLSNRPVDSVNSTFSVNNNKTYKNNENMRPGAYVNTVKNGFEALKKLSNTSTTGTNGLRFLLTNNVEISNNGTYQTNPNQNFSNYLEQHGRNALGLEPKVPNSFSTPRDNTWIG